MGKDTHVARTHTRTLTPATGDSSPCGRAAVLWSSPLPRGGDFRRDIQEPPGASAGALGSSAPATGTEGSSALTHLGPEIKSFGPRAETQPVSGPLELAAQQTTAAASPDAALVPEGDGGGVGVGRLLPAASALTPKASGVPGSKLERGRGCCSFSAWSGGRSAVRMVRPGPPSLIRTEKRPWETWREVPRRRSSPCLCIQSHHRWALAGQTVPDNRYTTRLREFPGGPVVRVRHFRCHGPGFNPWLGN